MEKSREKERLLKKISILADEHSVNIDLLETEAIRKLNKIPTGYFIITE